jgi:hypothetical protein
MFANNLISLLFLIIGIAVIVIVFLFIRGLVLWYFKIDRHLENQEKIIDLLNLLLARQERQGINQTPSLRPEQPTNPKR